jgi:hypothetical protein
MQKTTCSFQLSFQVLFLIFLNGVKHLTTVTSLHVQVLIICIFTEIMVNIKLLHL